MSDYIPVYVNDSGDLWVERLVAPWSRIQHEARSVADEMLDSYPGGVLHYEGVEEDVRVSDVNEAACEEPCTCCRTITAHHFVVAEP